MSIQFRTRSKGFNVDPNTLSGACCNPDTGNCTDTTLANCPSDSSFYAGKSCREDNPCVVGATSRSFYGVCCDGEGFCDITTQEECDCRNGTCCMGSFIKGNSGDYSWAGLCKDLKPCECLEQGGVPRGPLSTCAEINLVGGCGVTGATAYGSCCTTGNCLSPDDKGHPHGYTAGDCAVLGGLWGGSGSACNDGTTFSNSWPCSWPTGSCCFGHHPYNGVTYCDSGKTCGDCLNDPPGGSGGMAWTIGVTCGTLTEIDGVLCTPPVGTEKGTCCIPEYFGVEDPDILPFIVDYNCYVTSENRCIGLGGLWNNENNSCDDIDCCSTYGDCTFGEDGACCQFNINNGQFLQCDSTTIYHCEQIAANNTNITTLFHTGEECNEETGYPCTDAIFTTDSCCMWQKDGTYIGCKNIGENDPCPPTDIHIGIRFDQPCQSPGFNCSAQEVGACCYGSRCSFTSRGQCVELDGVFYEGLNCDTDCDVLPCCSPTTPTVITGYNKNNKPIPRHGVDGCLDSFSVSSHLDKEFASDYLIDFAIDNPDAVYSVKNTEYNHHCEDCDCPYSRNRGSCCWDGKCVPSITENECRQLGGVFQGCSGLPFEHVSQSWSTNNPCIEAGCAEQRFITPEDCGEDEPNCEGACCIGGDGCAGGSCSIKTIADCESSGGCFYGCFTECCQNTMPTSMACCYVDGDPKCVNVEDGQYGTSAFQWCTEQNSGFPQGYGSSCEDLHNYQDTENQCSSCWQFESGDAIGHCCFYIDSNTSSCAGDYPRLQCLFDGGCWGSGSNCPEDGMCVVDGGFPKTCDSYQSDPDEPEWHGSMEWGACCNTPDGTCIEMTLQDAQELCTGDNRIFSIGTHCSSVDCGGNCIDCDTDLCPECKPCCKIQNPEDPTGIYVCENLKPQQCIDEGGTPQYQGGHCSDIAVVQGNQVWNQGQIYCNYCGWKFDQFDSTVGVASNENSSCVACCGGGCENDTTPCDCSPAPTYQDHFDVTQCDGGGHVTITDIENCQTEEGVYNEDEWCVECGCEGTGACCSLPSQCTGELEFAPRCETYDCDDWDSVEPCCCNDFDGGEWVGCENSNLQDKCKKYTRLACEEGQPNTGQVEGGVWMGPGSICPNNEDLGNGWCEENIAPCCSCSQPSQGWANGNEPDSWTSDCPNGPEGGGNCCEQAGFAPGVGQPPWTGTYCKHLSAYDVNAGKCKNEEGPDEGSDAYVGDFGTYCKDQVPNVDGEDTMSGLGSSCTTCDLGDGGLGACCSCHRFAIDYPFAIPNGQWDAGCEEENCGCHTGGGYGSGQCFVTTKNECDRLNKHGAPGIDPAISVKCEDWNGDPFTNWKYPECNSIPGVHAVANSSEWDGSGTTLWGANEFAPKWTWWGPHGNGAGYTPLEQGNPDSLTTCELSDGFGGNDNGWPYDENACSVIQACQAFYSGQPIADRVWNEYSWCGYALSFSHSGAILAGRSYFANYKIAMNREWAAPWCRDDEECRSSIEYGGYGLFGNNDPTSEWYHKGTPLRERGWCEGRDELCGTGCPNCRYETLPLPPDFPSSVVLRLAQSGGGAEEDCTRSCKTFGACCTGEKCSRWPKHECLLLGGVYLGDYPCSTFGCDWESDSRHDPNTSDRNPWHPNTSNCDICVAVSEYMDTGEGLRGANDIQYELFLTGRQDIDASVPFFGFVDVETKPIDIQKDALPPTTEGKSLMYWKIAGDRIQDTSMIDLPFPTDPTSYQYLQGHYQEQYGKQNKFYWGTDKTEDFVEYKNNISQLWLTRKYQTPENVELSNTFEPYYHSKVEFSQVPNLQKFVINPARYGHGRNEYNELEEWQNCGDMVGYYIGLYLARDMNNSGGRGSRVKTLIAEDSSIDATCTPMQYFNTSQLSNLEVVNMSNNELYRLDIGRENKITELWAENNKLGSATGTSWIDFEGYPTAQENFPMYRLSRIQRLILSNNDIKSLDTQSVIFRDLNSLSAYNNPNLNNENALHLNAPVLEYLDLSECSLGAGIILDNVSKLKQLILRNVNGLGGNEDSLFNFIVKRNGELANLNYLILTNSKLTSLNLGTDSQEEWENYGETGNYNNYGHKFLNLKYIDLSNNSGLTNILLPKPSDSYSSSNKEYIEYLNISGTAIGENIDEFFSQSVFLRPNSYPDGHSLEVSARNITDASGNKVTLSLDKYNEIINLWDGSGKFIILDVDIDK